MRWGPLVASGLAAWTLASCAAMVGQGELEEGVASDLQDSGEPVQSVSCEDGLTRDVGSSTDCAVDYGEHERAITVSVTEVDGGEVLYELVWND
ncbi:DUF4333 domain-containing protein [Haloechinothrix sp. YIM 98757]|uniref:DUF4333 domain-containing protein n=1 Tax=Haloechinothrix aidingensis TaxID=2752311 RepID=A0A838A5W6_9PSEU|nr:DUF4333 domain-containing protein [Haloechinothrix aidingensis]MBA0124155.1 DUF4333 domain-containing protein [Haloechinothrix aidingensis]